MQDLRRPLWPHARGAGQLVRRVAAQRDEVGHLLRLDVVALANLVGPDPRELAHAAGRRENRHGLGRKLERIAVRGDDERRPALLLRRRHGRSQEVVRLVARRLAGREAQRAHELGQHRELLEQRGVEHAAALVAVECFVPVRRNLERVPADDDAPRLLRVPEPRQEVREPDDRARRPAARTLDRLRQRVVGAVRQRVAVDDEQRLHNALSSSAIAAISRSVPITAASLAFRSRRSSSSIGVP